MADKDFFNDDHVERASPSAVDPGDRLGKTLLEAAPFASLVDQANRVGVTQIAGIVTARTTGTTLTAGVGQAISYNRVETTFGAQPPVLLKDSNLVASGEIHGEALEAQTAGFHIAFSYVTASFATAANSFGEQWHTINGAASLIRRYDTLVKPGTTGGSDIFRFTTWTPLVLKKGDQVRSFWVFIGGNAVIDADLVNNIYPRFGLIRLVTI